MAYEPNSLPPKGGCPFHAGADPKKFVHFNERIAASKVRARSTSFSDHTSQAELFYNSQTEVEKTHIKNAFTFELSKVKSPDVRNRMCEMLMFVDADLAREVASKVGVKLPNKPQIPPTAADPENNIVPPNRSLEAAKENDVEIHAEVDLPSSSKALGIIANNPKQVKSRKVAILTSPNTKPSEVQAIKLVLDKNKVGAEMIVTEFSKNKDNDQVKNVENFLASTPSHRYDGVIVLAKADDYENAKDLGCALRFVGQAFKHCKTIAASPSAETLVKQATMGMHAKDKGVVVGEKNVTDMTNRFVKMLGEHRHWEREAAVEALPY